MKENDSCPGCGRKPPCIYCSGFSPGGVRVKKPTPRRIALAVLLLALPLAGCCGDLKGYVHEDRMTREAFADFYQRHKGEEPESRQDALERWWKGWEVRLKEAEAAQ